MTVRALRVGTRGSELALIQTRAIVAALQQRISGLEIAIEVIRTKGDLVTDVPLEKVGDKGLFIKDIEIALLENRVDFAVHSMKDVPSEVPQGLVLAATTARIDPRDALVARGARSLDALPRGSTLATGSLRRRAQVLARRPDLNVHDLRGNVPTRLRKFENSRWDAVILAGAGLTRLGLADRITSWIPTDQMLPAVGQGALALESREEDGDVRRWLAELHHAPSAVAVLAERAFLRRLEGGCQAPIAALGSVDEEVERVVLEGFLGTLDGQRSLRRRAEGRAAEAAELGLRLAEDMLAAGGHEVLEECRSQAETGRR